MLSAIPYHLGQIGTGTLTNDLKLWWAKTRGKPNPLLKILSCITAPTSWQVRVRGRIASLLEVGTGFRPDPILRSGSGVPLLSVEDIAGQVRLAGITV